MTNFFGFAPDPAAEFSGYYQSNKQGPTLMNQINFTDTGLTCGNQTDNSHPPIYSRFGGIPDAAQIGILERSINRTPPSFASEARLTAWASANPTVEAFVTFK